MRTINEVAMDIEGQWAGKVSFGARPYLTAMLSLSTMEDKLGLDSAKDIVLRFLSNSSSFRGAGARELKAELLKMVSAADKPPKRGK